MFGIGADGEWLALPPDYTTMGWTMRLVGGVIGCVLFVYLYVAQRAYLSRRRSRSFTGRIARIGLAVSLVSITWEFALLGLVLLLVLALAYGLFARVSNEALMRRRVRGFGVGATPTSRLDFQG